MKKAFATLLTATFLLTSCTAVNESTVSSVSETEISSSETATTVESTALFEKADQYQVCCRIRNQTGRQSPFLQN